MIKRKIWIINQYAWSPLYGKWIRHHYFAKYLNADFDITIFSGSYLPGFKSNLVPWYKLKAKEKYEGVNYIYIRTNKYKGNGIGRLVSIFLYTFKLLVLTMFCFKKPDIIYASSGHPLTWLIARFYKKIFKTKIILETRDFWPLTLIDMNIIDEKSFMAKLLYRIEKKSFISADHLIFTMPGGIDYAITKYKLNTEKISYINNGVDLLSFNKNKIANKCNIFFDENNFNVVYTGAIASYNGLEILIDTIKYINKFKTDIIFHIFGDGTHKISLEEMCNKNKIENIIFYGSVEQACIPSILASADLNLMLGLKLSLNRFGLSPNKLFEYLASGKPTISNRPNPYDLLEDYNAGTVVENGNAKDLAECILNYYKMDDVKYNTICQNALIASNNFDYYKLSSDLKDVFDKLI